MTQKEINEGNRIIAQFMGLRQGKEGEKRWKLDWFDTNGRRFEFLRYDSSCEWLMPVVEQIEKQTEWGLVMYPDMCYWNRFGDKPVGLEDDFCGSRIKCAYEAVVEFIKWYNKNK